MIRIIFLLIFFCFLGLNIFAQSEETEPPGLLGSKWRIGFTPTALINTYSGIQFSGEYEAVRRLSLVAEAAYIFFDLNTGNNLQGIRFRPQLKFAIFKNRRFESTISMLYNLRYTTHTVTAQVTKGNGNYVETVEGKRATYYKGFGLMFQQGFLFNEFGFNMGVGFGSGSVSLKDFNPETENLVNNRYRFWFQRNSNGSFNVPLIIFHLNFYIF